MTEHTGKQFLIHTPVTCLTLNPAVDVTVNLEKLSVGIVNRALSSHREPGGKGINVAATLAAGGFKTSATGILGAENAVLFRDFFAKRGIEDHFLYVNGATRSNIKIVSATETTDINEAGLPVTPALAEQLRNILAQAESDFLVLSGSLPPHCPDTFYADFLQFYAKRADNSFPKAKCVVDCSGAALKALLSSPVRPFCIKPNRDELAEWLGKPLKTTGEILQEARKLQQSGIALVVVSMGGEGALFVGNLAAYHAQITLDRIKSTVGAGDAMMAGIIAACLQHKIRDAAIMPAQLEAVAKTASLWAAGKLECIGATLPSQERLAILAERLRCEKLN